MNRKPLITPVVGALALVLAFGGSARAQDPQPPQPPLLDAAPLLQESDFMPQIVQQPASPNSVRVETTMAYVGQLTNKSNGNPVNGACDFRFKLWDALDGGTQIGSEKTLTLNVSRGLFKAELDFGNQFTGDARWLQTDVKCSGDPSFVEFKPRQALNAVPYAMGLRPGAVIASSAENALTLNSTESGILGVSSGDKPALLGINTNNGYGLQGRSARSYGVVGTSRDSLGVYGVSQTGNGVFGQSASAAGVWGDGKSSAGVYGRSADSYGVHGHGLNQYGVYATSEKGSAALAAYHWGTGDLIRAFNTDISKSTTGVFAVRNNGRVWTSAVEIYGGGDLAERFDLAGEQAAEPGTVMVIDEANPGKLKVSASPYDSKVAGIVKRQMHLLQRGADMKQCLRSFIRVVWPGLMIGLFMLGCALWSDSAQAQDADLPCTECLIASEAALADIPPGYKIIEGDILVPVDFALSREPVGDEPITHSPFIASTQFWPGGVVPYIFSDNVTVATQDKMLGAMAEWEKAANVDFRPWSRDTGYLLIRDSTGNNSEVGWQGRKQDVNIFNWDKYVMVHELGHALGFWHEQSRKDRDTYIKVHYENIEAEYAFAFDKHNEANHYGPYDFESVMHYSPCAFSVNKFECVSSGGAISPTISLQPDYATWKGKFGLLNRLSYMDKTIMSFIYPKPDWRFVDPAFAGNETGAFLTPYKQLATGLSNVPTSGTLWVQPGTYASTGVYNKPMTIQAPLGNVILVR